MGGTFIKKPKKILSISSMSSMTLVGNRVFDSVCSMNGVECLIVNTYFCKKVATSKDSVFRYTPTYDEIFHQVHAILTEERLELITIGFLGCEHVSNAVLDALLQAKKDTPIVLDFTFGNNDINKSYVNQGCIDSILKIANLADIVKCNAFEARYLTQDILTNKSVMISGIKVDNASDVAAVSDWTSVINTITTKHSSAQGLKGEAKILGKILSVLFTNNGECTHYQNNMLTDSTIKGAGDLLCALFIIYYIKGYNIKSAFLRSSDKVYEIIKSNIKHYGTHCIVCFNGDSDVSVICR